MEGFKLLRVKKQQFGRIFGIKEFLDLEHFGKQHDRTFPLLSSPTFPLLSGSFNAFFLLDIKFGWRGAQVEFLSSIFEAERYNSAQALTLGEKISRLRPVDPPTKDTRRYGAERAETNPKLCTYWE